MTSGERPGGVPQGWQTQAPNQAPPGWPPPPPTWSPQPGGMLPAGYVYVPVAVETKSRTVAAALALLLGSLGLHKFYLGKVGQGILYLLFCWAYIPGIIAWFEGIGYLLTSDTEWAAQHGWPVRRTSGAAIGCLWVVALLPLLSIAAVIGLLLASSQIDSILSTIGNNLQTTAP